MGKKEEEEAAALAKKEAAVLLAADAAEKEAAAAAEQEKVNGAVKVQMDVYNTRLKKIFTDLEKELNLECIDVSYYALSKQKWTTSYFS